MNVRYGSTIKHARPKIYTEKITLMFDKKTLEKFKSIVGKGYQVKIRELVQMYLDAYERKLNERK